MSKTTLKKNYTILIVEDEEALQNSLREVLRHEDLSTIKAKNGNEAVVLALASHPDLILLDLLLPIMSGMAALKKIREDEWGKNVPVIMLTNLSATDEQLIEDMVAQGPFYYLMKSDWKIHDVAKLIKKVLGKKARELPTL